MKKFNNKRLVTLGMIYLILLIILHGLIHPKLSGFSVFHFYLKGIQLFVLFICFRVTLKLKNMKFNVGLSFISFAALLDLIGALIYKHTSSNNLLSVLYCLLYIIGITYIIFGKEENIANFNRLNYKLSTSNEDLRNMAFNNPVTNLPNRNYLLTICKETDLEHCSGDLCLFKDSILKNHKVGILFFDIDDFKMINDFSGHATGDEILRLVAERLRSTLSPDDTIIHLSGDEFLLIINNVDEIEKITRKIISIVNRPYQVSNREILITCSIGIAFYPTHGHHLEVLMKKADIAMYEAKKTGKNNYFLFDERLEQEFNDRYNLIHELKNAINNNEFVVYYQKKANIQNNDITGLEALVRWNHPSHGIISPNEFIPLAEEIGLIHKIDTIVLQLASKQISEWKSKGDPIYNISVNISPFFFMSNTFLEDLDQILFEFNIDPKYLSLEITENIALKNIHKTKSNMEALSQRQIKLHIDDFGKGYSSLTYLKEFAFDYLKIDKAFVDGILENNVDLEIIKMIINLSKLFGFRIICEGIESEHQLKILKDLGCHEYQGYLLNKPQPIEVLGL